ncbi:hypothetical protein KJ590_00215 [Patescibacteria group bacterium]|nr:hypothetical protein [Patescibacteria group bacterium]
MSKKGVWRIAKSAGYRSVPEMAQGLAQKMCGQDLIQFLKESRVSRILIGIEPGGGVAWLTAETVCRYPTYRITLHPNRSISNWIEDLGHEIGHLLAWGLGSAPLFKTDHIFAETFAMVWSQITENRIAARKIFCKLKKERKIRL